MEFLSDNRYYHVTIPDCLERKELEIREYVHRVESLLPALEETFCLAPSHCSFSVGFAELRTSLYPGQARIRLEQDLDFSRDEHVYGGLFHETVHGFVEGYTFRRRNDVPEACIRILQVAALKNMECDAAKQWAEKYTVSGGDESPNAKLWSIYRTKGYDPIHCLYAAMARSRAPIIHESRFSRDVNQIWKIANLDCRMD